MDDAPGTPVVAGVESRAGGSWDGGPGDGGPGDGGSGDGGPWDGERWRRILDRIEQRQVGVGLKYWGPPLWLEVTMTGPDSDAWSTAGLDDGVEPASGWPSWDWQSNEPCFEAMSLAATGVDDDELVEVAARYTLENLVLNATHEIGEWLRFDARRPFTAHLQRPDPAASDVQSASNVHSGRDVQSGVGMEMEDPAGDVVPPSGDRQGNGLVHVEVIFSSTDPCHPAPSSLGAATVAAGEDLRRRVGAWRFSYRPDTEIRFEPDGPAITSRLADGSGRHGQWRSTWSAATLARLAGSDAGLADAVGRELHQMLVQVEADQICDAFFVDGRRPWYLDCCDLHRSFVLDGPDAPVEGLQAAPRDLTGRRPVLVRVQVGDQANNWP